MFSAYLLIFLTLVAVLLWRQILQKKLVNKRQANKQMLVIGLIVLCWILSRVAFLTDAFVNYNFRLYSILTSIPLFFNYITCAVLIELKLNLLILFKTAR